MYLRFVFNVVDYLTLYSHKEIGVRRSRREIIIRPKVFNFFHSSGMIVHNDYSVTVVVGVIFYAIYVDRRTWRVLDAPTV